MAKYTPPSGREHPPKAGAHNPGPSTNCDTSAQGSSQSNAVTRSPHGLKTK